jgi:hypothetical protein
MDAEVEEVLGTCSDCQGEQAFPAPSKAIKVRGRADYIIFAETLNGFVEEYLSLIEKP